MTVDEMLAKKTAEIQAELALWASINGVLGPGQVLLFGMAIQPGCLATAVDQEKIDTMMKMRLRDFFTPERLEEAAVVVKHNLSRISRIWLFEDVEDERDPPHWIQSDPHLRTVQDLVEFGARNILHANYKIGKGTLGAIQKVLGHNGIQLKP